MKLNNEYMREHLKHVYWLTGGACAGKTTMTKMFIEEKGFQTLSDDIMKYRVFANPEAYPAMQMPHPDLNWNEWFNRPVDIYAKWLLQVNEELLDFFLLDLLRLDNHVPVMIDLGALPEHILPCIPKDRILCLHSDDETIAKEYLYREDHKMILDCIENCTSNPEQAKRNVSDSVCAFSSRIIESCKSLNINRIHRTNSMSKEEQYTLVKSYFGIA